MVSGAIVLSLETPKPSALQQRPPCTWVILTFGGDRQYGGNSEYEDSSSEYYRYDSFVANHRQVRRGDIAIVCDEHFVVGASQIDHIEAVAGFKNFQRCPSCRTPGIKERKTREPRFRCN